MLIGIHCFKLKKPVKWHVFDRPKCLHIFSDFSADFYALQVPVLEYNLHRLSAQFGEHPLGETQVVTL